MSVFKSNSGNLRKVLIFCFHLKKTAAATHWMLSSIYSVAALSGIACRERFQRFRSGDFDVKDQHGDGKEKFFEDSELEALLAEDLYQTQEESAELLGVTQQTISKRLKAMEMIQKQGNLVPYEFLVNSCFEDRIGRGFYIALWPATKNGSTTIIPSAENHGECPDMSPRRRPDRLFTLPKLCSAFGGTSWVWCIMSCWNLVKPSQGISSKRNWCIWAEYWRRNGPSKRKDTTKSSSSMTMLVQSSVGSSY